MQAAEIESECMRKLGEVLPFLPLDVHRYAFGVSRSACAERKEFDLERIFNRAHELATSPDFLSLLADYEANVTDEVVGVFPATNGENYILFTRESGHGSLLPFWLMMAQHGTYHHVYQVCESKPVGLFTKRFQVSLTARDCKQRVTIEADPAKILHHLGVDHLFFDCFLRAHMLITRFGGQPFKVPGHGRPAFWLPYCRIGLKRFQPPLMTSSDPYSDLPEEWLTPKATDQAQCAFYSGNQLTLVLLIRSVETKPSKQEFLMAADPRGAVCLVTKLEVRGMFSKDVYIEVLGEKTRAPLPMKIPMSHLDLSDQQNLSRLLATELARSLSVRRIESLPDGLFLSTPILGRQPQV